MLPAGFQGQHWQTEWMASLETRNAKGPWLNKKPCQVNKLFFCGSSAATLFILMGSCVKRFCKVLQSDTQLYWIPASLVNEECILPRGPPTDASCSCTLLPVCALSLLSEEHCCCKVRTPSEFKWSCSEWGNAHVLAGHSSFRSLIHFLQWSIQLLIGWLLQRNTQRWTQDPLCFSFFLVFCQRKSDFACIVLLASTAVQHYSG